VCPALWPPCDTRDDRKVRRQQIDDLALAFVSPLGAETAMFIARHSTLSDERVEGRQNGGVVK
jgi:hypothetical protein